MQWEWSASYSRIHIYILSIYTCSHTNIYVHTCIYIYTSVYIYIHAIPKIYIYIHVYTSIISFPRSDATVERIIYQEAHIYIYMHVFPHRYIWGQIYIYIYRSMYAPCDNRVAWSHRMPYLHRSFSQKSPVISGSFAKNDLQLKTSYECRHPVHVYV